MNKEKIREKERRKYNKSYFENFYWAEDFPVRKHYKNFSYNDPTHEKRFRFLTDLLIQNFKFHTFFDAGCGMGQLLRNLLSKKYKCKGAEVSETALKIYLKGHVEKKYFIRLA